MAGGELTEIGFRIEIGKFLSEFFTKEFQSLYRLLEVVSDLSHCYYYKLKYQDLIKGIKL